VATKKKGQLYFLSLISTLEVAMELFLASYLGNIKVELEH
jgi:hypothetical protein